jgi:predicted tellurium resistance membrane protein TerC
MDNNTATSSSSIGFTSLLTLLFIALKLTGYIQWSWWWVLSPIWISFSLIILIVIILLMISAVVNKPKSKK